MKGSPAKLGTISGTAGHSSALKMKAEADAASALKYTTNKGDNPPPISTEEDAPVVPKLTKHGTKTYKTAYEGLKDDGKGGKTDKYGKTYKSQEDFNKAADDWWKSEAGQKKASAKGSKFAHRIIKKEAPVTEDKTKDKTKLTKTEKVVAKGDKKIGEVKENVTRKSARIARRKARKEHGRGSKEHLEAKKAHLEAKEADRQGAQGGKKRGLFRKALSKRNLKRQAKVQAKIDAAKEEEK